ncbi:glycosyltransferase family 2 protein [Acinetobacter baumannii]|uniref:glycosyltransferase family 2 protein n=1 Tax=Acinetobacter baumannii TaxID=470 RepID=UPI002649EA0B|nr:glycosyltransferase family 2 protein [Acinetobacter baumannii]MCZ2937737.1 glycosyltransferase family 2 protein [Acinetobacter baumannii]
MISLITATYNREKLLGKLYESLCVQTVKNFEWIVIDDGSIDKTDDLINSFKLDNIIDITYLKKENGGKHTAMNIGVEIAKYAYVFFIDSDDFLPNDSIEKIINYIDKVSTREDYSEISGVCGLIADFQGNLIGTKYSDNLCCSYIDYRYKYHIKGDKAEIFKRDVLLEYKFPVIEKEKFCPEALVWNRISNKYKMYFFNEVIYYREYLEGGLSDRSVEIRKKAPISTLLYYKELYLNENLNWYYRVRAYINYIRFKFIS